MEDYLESSIVRDWIGMKWQGFGADEIKQSLKNCVGYKASAYLLNDLYSLFIYRRQMYIYISGIRNAIQIWNKAFHNVNILFYVSFVSVPASVRNIFYI